MYEKHLRKMCRLLSDDKGAATHKKIPDHEHIIEYCKRIGCNYWEKEVTSKVYQKNKKQIPYMEQYQAFVILTMNYHIYKEGDPIREKFKTFLKK